MDDKNKIKILQVVDGFRMGGAETKLCELVSCLDKTKYQNMVANVGPAGPLADRFSRLNVPVFQCQRRHRFDIKVLWRLCDLMKENQIDIVQTTLFWADFIGTFAARKAGVPVTLSWETVSHEGDRFHNKWQRRSGYRLAMHFADGVVAVSHEVKNSLIQRRHLSADKIHVIHYGVDLSKFVPDPDGVVPQKRIELGFMEGETAIAVVARLEEIKGHKYYIEAFKNIAAKYPKVSTVFVGDGESRPELENMVRDAGLGNRIRFLGYRDDVAEILKAIDVFVLPSISEGLPNVILEAMACGKPVIATNVGGIPEAIRHGENGFLVPPKDAVALANALENMLCDRQKLLWYGHNARATVEREFSLQKQIASFEQLYDALYQQKVMRRLGSARF
ncbi:MAG: glycosyltransferase [candidate division KSB1 bacterium]|nr:glycosyltransferase [candidate division KSB1 bacterium]MDZ7300907.1 glycosyltransferase [candidate division KSB1 bacterium]MDZ7314059.1 glycosyltransferase [candidate division KSB1 bacterium]